MTERDDVVSKRYRELPAEEPPRALDEAILAASRRAAGSRPAPRRDSPWTPTGRQRWYVPLAAAAVIVLAVGLTLRVQLEKPDVVEEVTPPSPKVLKEAPPKDVARMEAKPFAEEQVKADEKRAVEDARRAAAAPKAAAEPAPREHARQAPESRVREKLGESSAQGTASAPAPFPAQPAPSTRAEGQRNAEADAMMQRAPAAEAPAAPAVAGAAPPPPPAAKPAPQAPRAQSVPAPEARSDDAARDRAERALASGATAKRQMEAPETPEKMLERIAELRKAGKHDEADKALAEFRKRFPDYKLTDEMKAKVERSLAR